MRLRLGLLRDSAAIEKQIAKEQAEAAAKKQKLLNTPTVKTEAQTKAEEAAVVKSKEKGADIPKPAAKPRIRPLSEAKAIESGATFISEAFLFAVGGGLILFESWRSRRKETSRREDVADRIAELEDSEKAGKRALLELERELLRLRAKNETTPTTKRILPREVYELEASEEKGEEVKVQGWLTRIAGYVSGKRGAEEPAIDRKALEPPPVTVASVKKALDEGPRKESVEKRQQFLARRKADCKELY